MLEKFKLKYSSFKLMFFLLTTFAVTLLIILPSFKLRWDLVDDGIDIAGAYLIEYSIREGNPNFAKQVFFEEHFARVRPTYWLWFWSIYHFIGTDPFYYHLIHGIFFIFSVILVFLIVFVLTHTYLPAFISSLLYATQPYDIENWYFLGRQEPIQNTFFLLAIFLLILTYRKKLTNKFIFILFIISIISLILSILSKETAISYVPPLIFLYIATKSQLKLATSKKQLLMFLVAAIISSLFIIVSLKLMRSNSEGYFQKYEPLQLNSFLDRLNIYYLYFSRNFSKLFILPIITFGIYLISRRFNTLLTTWQIFFLLCSITSSLILLPFSVRAEGYYLAPAFMFFIVFTGLELNRLISSVKKQSLLTACIVILFGFVFIRNYLYLSSYIKEFMTVQLINSQMMEFVVNNTQIYPKVLFNFNEGNRGYIGGIRIQRASIFSCNSINISLLLTYEKDSCNDQSFTHIKSPNDQISFSDYDLIVASYGSIYSIGTNSIPPIYPLKNIQVNNITLKEVKTFSNKTYVLNRSVWLEDYLKLSLIHIRSSIKDTIKRRQLVLYPIRIEYTQVNPRWELYEIIKN